VTLAGPNRLLRIRVDVRRSNGELIALLGHELQHAVEILSNPALRNNAQVLTFYQSAGIFGGTNIVETDAAVEVQQKISHEIRNAGAHVAATPAALGKKSTASRRSDVQGTDAQAEIGTRQ
jgi:hypothetical protein